MIRTIELDGIITAASAILGCADTYPDEGRKSAIHRSLVTAIEDLMFDGRFRDTSEIWRVVEEFYLLPIWDESVASDNDSVFAAQCREISRRLLAAAARLEG